LGVSHRESPSHLGRAQWLAEEVLGWAGLDLTILRIASLFYENVPTLHGRSIRDEGTIRNCFGDVRLSWISGEDAAGIGLAALLHPSVFEGGMVQYIRQGAELLSHAEVARVLSEELSRPIRFEPLRARPGGTSCWRSLKRTGRSGEPRYGRSYLYPRRGRGRSGEGGRAGRLMQPRCSA